MELPQAIGIAVAAFVGVGINAVAGGGSLVSFPALLAIGYPAKVANITNTVALWPGYLGGSIGYRALLIPQRRTIAILSVSGILGAVAGGLILLLTSEAAFRAIVPFLILFAAALLAFQVRLAAFIARVPRPWHTGSTVPLELHIPMFLLGVYGAYFGAGLGTMTLAVLSILLPDDLQRSNALKGMLSLVINAVAVVVFVASGLVAWLPAAIMAVAALAGGYFGVGLARRLSPATLRWVVVIYSVAVALYLLLR